MKYKEAIINILIGLFVGALFIALVLLSSCSGEFHARQALKKGVSVLKTDTVIRIDTVWRTVETVDTVFRYDYDTVTYYQDCTKVVYHYDTLTNDVYIEVDCPDCPEIIKEVIIDNTVLVEEKKGFFSKMWIWMKGNLIIVVVVCVAIVLLPYMRKLIKWF